MEDLIDNYFLTLPEPEQSALLFVHSFLKNQIGLECQRKFNTPFYYYTGKWFCYLDYNKKKRSIHISFVKGSMLTHPKLFSEGRKQQKIYRIIPEKDINTKELITICQLLKKVYE